MDTDRLKVVNQLNKEIESLKNAIEHVEKQCESNFTLSWSEMRIVLPTLKAALSEKQKEFEAF